MWYKNFRSRKKQVLLIGIIVMLCTMAIGAAANLLFLLDKPYQKLREECKLPEVKIYLQDLPDEKVEKMVQNFKTLPSAKKVYAVTYANAEKSWYDGKLVNTYCNFTDYNKELFGKVRIVEGKRSDLENLKEDECFLPACVKKVDGKEIRIGDTYCGIIGGKKCYYKVKGFFSSPYDTSAAFDSYAFVKSLKPEMKINVKNQILVRTKDKDGDKVITEYRKKYDGHLPGIPETIEDAADNARVTNNILGAIFLGIGVVIFLASCLILLFMIKSMVQKDAKKIAIYKTLGYTFNDIIRMYIRFYAVLVGVASILGAVGAAVISRKLLQSTLENLGVAAKVENAGYSYLIILIIVLFILSLTWVLLSQMKKLKPVFVLRGISTGNTKKTKKKASYQGGFSVLSMAARNIVRNKKGIVSMLATAIVVAFIMNFAMISLNVTKKQKESNTFWFSLENCQIAADTADKKEYDRLREYLDTKKEVKNVVECEKNARIALKWKEGITNTNISTAVYPSLKNCDLPLVEGREPANEKEIVIGTKLGKKLKKQIGDYITFEDADGKEIDYLITGTFQTYYQMGEYMRMLKSGFDRTKNDLQYQYQMIYLNKGVSEGKFLKMLKKEFPKVSIQKRQNVYSNILNDMIVEPQEKAIPAMAALIMLISGISIFSIIALKNHEKQKTHEIYKAIGYQTTHLIGSNLLYTMLLAILAVLIAAPLCYFVYPQIMAMALSVFGMEKYPVWYEWNYILIANVSVVVLFVVSTLLSSLSLRKLDVRNLVQE